MDEYINREEVLSRIYATHSTGDFANEEAYLWLHDEITNLPSADVQPVKHGRWIEKKISYMKWVPNYDDDVNPDDVALESMTEHKCSCCKRWTIKFTHHIGLGYCPFCGAKMDGNSKC